MDEAVQLLAYLGSRLVLEPNARWNGGPFWTRFPPGQVSRVRNPKVWEWIVSKGGDERTPESLQKRIRMLKKAGVRDPRDGTSSRYGSDGLARGRARAGILSG